jgi:hypothetical protein
MSAKVHFTRHNSFHQSQRESDGTFVAGLTIRAPKGTNICGMAGGAAFEAGLNFRVPQPFTLLVKGAMLIIIPLPAQQVARFASQTKESKVCGMVL